GKEVDFKVFSQWTGCGHPSQDFTIIHSHSNLAFSKSFILTPQTKTLNSQQYPSSRFQSSAISEQHRRTSDQVPYAVSQPRKILRLGDLEMKFLGLEIRVLVIGFGQMHRSATSDLVKQDSVGHTARTDSDIKCAKDSAKEVGDKAASESDAARNQNQLVCKEPQPIGEGLVTSSMT
ncbi:MAG: hypothetical protein ACFFF9_11360, partial [Candidatus Thorarchaeota archaeon]